MKKFVYFCLITLLFSAYATDVPSPSSNAMQGIINVQSPKVMKPGQLSLSIYSLFGPPNVFRDNDHYKTSLKDSLTFVNHFALSFGVLKYLDASIKLSANYDYNSTRDPETKFNVNSMQFGLKYMIWSHSIFKVGFNPYIYFPIGKEYSADDYYYNLSLFEDEQVYEDKSSDRINFGGRFLGSAELGPLEIYGNVGYCFRRDHYDLISTYVGAEMETNPYVTLFTEFNGEFDRGDDDYDPMRVGGGLRFNLSDFQITNGFFFGLTDDATEWQAILGLSWSRDIMRYDSDNDGVIDRVDLCVDQPEDIDGFEDEDGCPDPDNDNDGILDINDKSPNDAEDFDGFKDDDGTPDYDNDGDGILDIDDKCPNKAEDFDGYADQDGCPDYDNDGDGIPDKEDKCPMKPEVYNGYQDDDGCPDRIPTDRLYKKNDQMTFNNIYFEFDSAKLTNNSHTILDNLKPIFDNNPNIVVQIEGHTDDLGSQKYNLKLSQKRAEAVRAYLIKNLNVNPDQLTAVGIGEAKPIASNKTEEGQAKNRRIVFKVLSNK